jgi:hypothetical protein
VGGTERLTIAKRWEQLKWATLKSKTKIIVLVNIIIILIGFNFLGYGYHKEDFEKPQK